MKKIIVGLGNPGNFFELTRHNAGFLIIDELLKKLNLSLNKKEFSGLYCQYRDWIFLKPQTYMNNSGSCLSSFANFFKVNPENILVIRDDIYLPLGKAKIRLEGIESGHNGIKDIIACLPKEKKIRQLKIGVGLDKKFRIRDWVLRNFSEEEVKIFLEKNKFIVDLLLKLIKGEEELEKITSFINGYQYLR